MWKISIRESLYNCFFKEDTFNHSDNFQTNSNNESWKTLEITPTIQSYCSTSNFSMDNMSTPTVESKVVHLDALDNYVVKYFVGIISWYEKNGSKWLHDGS